MKIYFDILRLPSLYIIFKQNINININKYSIIFFKDSVLLDSMSTCNFLLVGSGARETVLARKIRESQSDNVNLYCISTFIQPEIDDLCNNYFIFKSNNDEYDEDEYESELVKRYINVCKIQKIDYVIIGSEKYLMGDLVVELEKIGVFCIAPSKLYARIETSKIYCRNLFLKGDGTMVEYTPDYICIKYNTHLSAVSRFLKKYNNQIVVKPDAPCGGKGVKVFGEHLKTRKDILDYIIAIREQEIEVILEEKLVGKEFSLISIVDGNTCIHAPPIVDFKRLNNNNEGPNTGSMGCITDKDGLNFLTQRDIATATQINERILAILNNDNKDTGYNNKKYNHIFNIAYFNYFKGFLYGSFMKTDKGEIKVIEYNARLGDPEAIPLLQQLNIDFVSLCNHMKQQTLHTLKDCFKPQSSVCQYLVPAEYPNATSSFSFTLDSVTEKEDKHILFGSVELDEVTGIYTGLTSRNIAIYAQADTIQEANRIVSNIQEKITKENIGKFHVRTDLMSLYLGDKDGDKDKNEYKQAGVNVDLGNQIIKDIAPVVKSTYNENVLNEIGGFGGCFDCKQFNKECAEPILVSSIDGVGTKSIVSVDHLGVKGYYNLGQDIVNHCVNDILVQGAKPLFFMDYIAASKLSSECVLEFVKGIAYACKQCNCVLLGGETAEMPNVYKGDRYDLVGCITGVVDKHKMVLGKQDIKTNDCILAIPSSGLHTNGYSLVRKIIRDMKESGQEGEITLEFMDALSEPHKSYLPEIEKIMEASIPFHGLCHVTGGGFDDNIVRILPNNMKAQFTEFDFSPLFKKIQKMGNISRKTMMEVFNCGWGMLLVVDPFYEDHIKNLIPSIKNIGTILKKI